MDNNENFRIAKRFLVKEDGRQEYVETMIDDSEIHQEICKF